MRYVFEGSTRSVDKRSSYIRELVWQPSWQLDTCPDRLNSASVYTVNCELCTASAQRTVPTAGHACGRVVHSTVVKYLTTFRTQAFNAKLQTNNPKSGFNSDHTIRQYAHGLLLESQFLLSSTDCWAIRAKIRQKRPSWWP